MKLKEHRHTLENGFIKHSHLVGNPDYVDGFDEETHSHLVVLHDRNYVHEFSGEAEWTEA